MTSLCLECLHRSFSHKFSCVDYIHILYYYICCSFPRDHDLQIRWIEATGRNNWTPKLSSRICSTHFEKNVLIKKNKLTVLFPNSIPLLLG
ncbi:unnamed protein product [Leptidea sinapis]|uniref:THAP-type domain-containing protein n=1 Tax=Leptidea sinapis TaxID=189913 RepID=A0A5E4PNZ7_9NEOP|nr:unnamed protein product [Leptidea sinapis]